MEKLLHKLVIIGSGPAGLTAAIYAARANLKPIVIDGDTPGGQLMKTSYVENWPGEKRILGPELMNNMRNHAHSLGAQFISGKVNAVDFSKKPFALTVDEKIHIKSQSIIIATGTTPKRLAIPGENEYWGKGVTTCAVCDGAFYPDKNVLIIGGGDTAMEDASFLKKFTKKITVVHILDKLTASHAMQQRVINDSDITIIYNSTITKIIGNGNHITSAIVTNQLTGKEETINVDGIFIAIGLNPNTIAFKNHLECDNHGFIKVTRNVHTSIQGIFAAGDVHDYCYRQAITAAGAGCMAALEAEKYISLLE